MNIESFLTADQPRTQLHTPPSSQGSETASRLPTPVRDLDIVLDRPRTPEELSASLSTLLVLHKCFLKALSIHFAHNGSAVPAKLATLMVTMTKIWKKQQIKLEDIQRMLALYEVSSSLDILPATCIQHNACPFRLNRTAAGINVEFIGEGPDRLVSFNEQCLDVGYEMDLRTLVIQFRTKPILAFLKGPLSGYPLLQITTGCQTAAAKHKAQSLRTELLGNGSRTPYRTSDSAEAKDNLIVPTSVKSRTLSLFDRIKQKHLAK